MASAVRPSSKTLHSSSGSDAAAGAGACFPHGLVATAFACFLSDAKQLTKKMVAAKTAARSQIGDEVLAGGRFFVEGPPRRSNH